MKMDQAAAGRSLAVMILCLILPAGSGLAQPAKSGEQKFDKPRAEQAQTAASGPVYRPPRRGAPGGRVGGGTRGIQREVFVLTVLAPDHNGLTVSEQPDLYWFISRPTSFPVELTVTDPRAVKPALEYRVPAPVQAGVHRLRLADHGIRLPIGIPYRWYVAVIPDSERRSKDILAGGAIERIEVAEEFKSRLAQARKAESPFLYAEAGIWYDALRAISELIETSPGNHELRKQRAALLSQVGLPAIDE